MMSKQQTLQSSVNNKNFNICSNTDAIILNKGAHIAAQT